MVVKSVSPGMANRKLPEECRQTITSSKTCESIQEFSSAVAALEMDDRDDAIQLMAPRRSLKEQDDSVILDSNLSMAVADLVLQRVDDSHLLDVECIALDEAADRRNVLQTSADVTKKEMAREEQLSATSAFTKEASCDLGEIEKPVPPAIPEDTNVVSWKDVVFETDVKNIQPSKVILTVGDDNQSIESDFPDASFGRKEKHVVADLPGSTNVVSWKEVVFETDVKNGQTSKVILSLGDDNQCIESDFPDESVGREEMQVVMDSPAHEQNISFGSVETKEVAVPSETTNSAFSCCAGFSGLVETLDLMLGTQLGTTTIVKGEEEEQVVIDTPAHEQMNDKSSEPTELSTSLRTTACAVDKPSTEPKGAETKVEKSSTGLAKPFIQSGTMEKKSETPSTSPETIEWVLNEPIYPAYGCC